MSSLALSESSNVRSFRRKLPLHDRLSAIIAVQNDLMGARHLEFTSFATLVAGKCERLTAADGALVALVEGPDLVVRAATGIATEHVSLRIPLAASVSGACVLNRTVIRCADANGTLRVDEVLRTRSGIESAIAVPLVTEGRAIGVLKIVSSRPNAFDEDDVHTLQLCAGLISAAMSRAAEYAALESLLAERELAAYARERDARLREEVALELEERSAMIRAYFEAIPLMLTVLERDGDDFRIVAANPATAAELKCPAEQIVGKLISQIRSSDTDRATVAAALNEAERSGKPVNYEESVERDGRLRHFAATASAIPSSPQGAKRFLFITQDVTERAQLRERAELNDRMLSVGRLAAGVAHEANNPLAYTISNLAFAKQLVEEDTKMDANERQDLLDALSDAQEGAGRVKLIIKDLYTFVRADAEVLETVDLKDVARRAIAMCGHAIFPVATVTQELAECSAVKGNAARLGQVIMNLLTNAAHAMPKRNARENLIQVTCGPTADAGAFVRVTDNGSGMSPEVLSRIFEPFFTTKTVGKGMGLGLSICHNIVAAHGGELRVSSAVGKGTTFELVLPPMPAP